MESPEHYFQGKNPSIVAYPTDAFQSITEERNEVGKHKEEMKTLFIS